jgi:hypothetical protein
MKKIGIPLYIILAYLLFFSSCSPTIQFKFKNPKRSQKTIYVKSVRDIRPVNERVGYKIFYIDSISDDDYADGFLNEFNEGLNDALQDCFKLVENEEEADIKLEVTVIHFYGEYSQSVKTVFWEYGSGLLLFIPRLLTDAIPYNHFAGRAAFKLEFSSASSEPIQKTVDIKITDTVTSYARGSADTASRLSKAASPQFENAIREVKDEL